MIHSIRFQWKEGISMPKLITVKRAKEEIERLNHYINLVEAYETDTIEK